MKKIFTLFLAMLSMSLAFSELKTGTYDLYGSSASGNVYRGTVVIVPQGYNYSVTWYIASGQIQVGVGIYDDWQDVLSVAFADLSKSYWGVVSYRVGTWSDLEGRWTSSDGYSQGTEHMKWVHY